VIKKHIELFFFAVGIRVTAKGPLIMVLTFPPLLSGVA
jgi:hypothetical protein